MRKCLLLLTLCIGTVQFCSAQNVLIEMFGMRRDDSTWWDKGDKFVGLHTNFATLGTDIIANGEYFFEPNLSLSGRLGMVSYRPSKFRSAYGHRAVMVSGDVHYYASLKKRYSIYAGPGISYIHFGNRVHSVTKGKIDSYNFGPSINLNVGAHYRLYKNIALFAEFGRKYAGANVSLGANVKLP